VDATLAGNPAVDDWNQAAAIRDALEAKMGAGKLPRVESPTFGQIAKDYLSDGLGHLAPTTTDDVNSMLTAGEMDESGAVVREAGPRTNSPRWRSTQAGPRSPRPASLSSGPAARRGPGRAGQLLEMVDRSRSLEDLEGEAWGDPADNSQLVLQVPSPPPHPASGTHNRGCGV